MPIELITKKNNIELVVPAGKGVAEAYEKGFNEAIALIPDFDKYAKTFTIASLNMFKTPVVELTFENHNGSFLNFCQVGAGEEFVNKTVEHITINSKTPPTTLQQMFYCSNNEYLDEKLKHITLNFDMSEVSSFNNTFRGLKALEIVDGQPLNLSKASALSSTFNLDSSLVEFRVVPYSVKQTFILGSNPNLSAETVESVIEGLADITGTTAKTLALHRTVGNKLTEEQKATIAAKGWTLSY